MSSKERTLERPPNGGFHVLVPLEAPAGYILHAETQGSAEKPSSKNHQRTVKEYSRLGRPAAAGCRSAALARWLRTYLKRLIEQSITYSVSEIPWDFRIIISFHLAEIFAKRPPGLSPRRRRARRAPSSAELCKFAFAPQTCPFRIHPSATFDQQPSGRCAHIHTPRLVL